MAKGTLSAMTVDRLAAIYRSEAQLMSARDTERRQHILVVSALLELLGGQAIIPSFALENSPGYQSKHTEDGALVLQTVDPSSDGH